MDCGTRKAAMESQERSPLEFLPSPTAQCFPAKAFFNNTHVSQEALRYLTGQPPSPPNFVVVSVFRQVEPSSVRLRIRPQVRIPSDSHGPAPLSPHRVAIDIPTPADVQEETVQVEVEEAADHPAPVEEQAQLPVPLRPVIPEFFRFPGIPGQQ
nr:hypothetical protein Iba_chr10cCG11950 [Ipomoea batatas]